MKLLKRTTALALVTVVLGTAACTNPSSDGAITSRVRSAISKEPGLKGTTIGISTDEKVVRLSGTVNSRAERAMAIAVARKVEGVKDVKTDLVVQADQESAAKPQAKSAAKPQQKTAAKPQQKPAVEARKKQLEARLQPTVTPHEQGFAGTGR